MQNRHDRNYFYSQLVFFLPDQDKLALRNVSKHNRENLRHHQDAPYQNKIEFIMGVGGLFHDKKYLRTAWRVYHSTTTSTSSKPAMLYKIADMDNYEVDGTLNRFLEKESGEATGRIYSPGRTHAWDVNQVWLLAQIHIARPFVVYSELTPKFVMRRNSPGVYSAFAKEVATAIKAGYTVNIRDNRIRLEPGKDKSIKQLSIDDAIAKDDEIQFAVDTANAVKNEINEVVQVAIGINKKFEEAENYDLNKLINFQISLNNGLIASSINIVFTDCKNKKLAFSSFVSEFNKRQSYFSPKLQDDSEYKLFFNVEQQIEKIKKIITVSADKRVKELIQNAQSSQSKFNHK